jgi:hypothetical protein
LDDDIATDLLKALLGNVLGNTFQHVTMGAVFPVDECYSSLLGGTTILATEGVFSLWSITHLYNESPLVARLDDIGKLVVEFPWSVQLEEDDSM